MEDQRERRNTLFKAITTKENYDLVRVSAKHAAPWLICWTSVREKGFLKKEKYQLHLWTGSFSWNRPSISFLSHHHFSLILSLSLDAEGQISPYKQPTSPWVINKGKDLTPGFRKTALVILMLHLEERQPLNKVWSSMPKWGTYPSGWW